MKADEVKLGDPFITETMNTFEIMIGVRPEVVDKIFDTNPDAPSDISASMGVSGGATGVVVLGFPKKVACRVVSKMLNEEITEATADVTDAVCELVNIVMGNAKRDLGKHGCKGLKVSLPNVVVGEHRNAWHSRDVPSLLVKFYAEGFGSFHLEVNIIPTESSEGTQA